MAVLTDILGKMSSVLDALHQVLEVEQQALSAGFVNGSALVRITQEKSSLLADLDYLEQQRRAEQPATSAAGQWLSIRQRTQRLNEINQHNGWLLAEQMKRNQQALEVLKPHQETGLYGANGQTRTYAPGGRKISI